MNYSDIQGFHRVIQRLNFSTYLMFNKFKERGRL